VRSARIDGGGKPCAEVGEGDGRQTEQRHHPQIEPVAAVVLPEAENDVGCHHDQSGALRQLLRHAEQQAEHGNGDQAAADAEDAADRAEQGAEQDIGQKGKRGHDTSRESAILPEIRCVASVASDPVASAGACDIAARTRHVVTGSPWSSPSRCLPSLPS
jgi:hypothetical protein